MCSKNAFDAKMLCFLLCKKQRCCPYILLVLNIFLWKMWCWTFSKGKCSANQNVRKRQNAVFFALQKTKAVQKCCVFCFAKNKDAVQKCIWCVHFVTQNVRIKCIWCQNAFLQRINKMLQMHLMRTFCFAKMLCFLLCKKQRCVHFVTQNVTNAFDAYILFCVAKMHFCIKCIFASTKCYKCIWCQNAFWRTFSKGKCSATRTFYFVKCSAYIFQRKMFSCAKMHLMQKCCVFCFAKNKDAYILLVQKCIFAKQNVTNAFLRTFYFVKCSAYIFQRKMFSITFSKGKCSAPTKCYKCIWCVAKMHFCIKCIWCKNAFLRTFSKGKCSASHFPKENVQHHIFQRKMFSITFSKGKCSGTQPCLHDCGKNLFLQSRFLHNRLEDT